MVEVVTNTTQTAAQTFSVSLSHTDPESTNHCSSAHFADTECHKSGSSHNGPIDCIFINHVLRIFGIEFELNL